MATALTDLQQRLVDIRRDLHQHPELSGQEERTATQICRFLDELGIAYRSGVGGHGIIADLPGRDTSRVIALRGDTDALPIQEETGLPFASAVPGVMHACGHDGHTTMLLGAAALLAAEPELPVSVRCIFQPAEEIAQGALGMIEAGALENVSMIFGGHLDRHYEVGQISVTDGPVNASSDKFYIHVRGKGGHAARPHEAIDAVVVGSLIVMSLQTIVSREINPAHPSVLTVGRFESGTAANVIASEARLEGTIRAQEQTVREHLWNSIQRTCDAVAVLHQAKVEVTIEKRTPPVVNARNMAELARQAAAETVGAENVTQMPHANMGGEDFGHYLQHVPGCYVRFGSLLAGHEGYPAHSSRFDFDEGALLVGARYYRNLALLAGTQLAGESA